MKKALLTLAGVALLIPGVAVATPTVTIDMPGEGQVIPTADALSLGGRVAFEEPQRTTTRYYLRVQSCENTQSNPTGAPQGKGLTLANPGTDTTAACLNGPYYRLTPANEVLKNKDLFWITDNSGFTFDASRPVTGQVTVQSYPVAGTWVGAGQTTIDIAVEGQKSGEGSVEFGKATVSYTAMPQEGPKAIPFSIIPTNTWDKKGLRAAGGNKFTMTITIRGTNAMHGFLVYNGGSYIDLPTWSASFNRRVEVAIDGGPFSPSGVELAGDVASWMATLPMPAPGVHTVRARAAQESTVSEAVTRTFTVAG